MSKATSAIPDFMPVSTSSSIRRSCQPIAPT
jgi:hypothetical protein